MSSAAGTYAHPSNSAKQSIFCKFEVKRFFGLEEGMKTYLSVCSVTTFSRLEDASICAYADCELSKIACVLRRMTQVSVDRPWKTTSLSHDGKTAVGFCSYT